MASTSDILADVRVILDHNDVTSSISGLTDEETLQLDDIITSQIIPAARIVELTAPDDLVDWQQVTDGSYDASANVYNVPLPEGYLRFGAAKLDTWAYGVSTLTPIDSKAYARQFGEFAGLKATPVRPMVALVNGDASTYNNTLQMFGADYSSSIEYCTIATEPTITSSTLSIGDALYQPFLYVCAAHTAEILRNTDAANQLMVIAKNLMGIQPEVVQSQTPIITT